MNKFELLDLLGESEYTSGEVIAEKFGVTRTAVWKAVTDLKKMGYEISSKTNNGYKLQKPFDILNEHEIKSRLQSKNLDFDVIYKKTTGSTNNDAKAAASENNGNNAIIAADELSAARGRYGRSFSAKNGGVYFTIKICRKNNFYNLEDIAFYPLIAAAATSRAVYEICGIDLSVKWPNDLLYKNNINNININGAKYKKVCGILTEASFQAENRDISYIIAGIGVNVNISEFDGDLKDVATSLKIISGRDFDRADLMCGIIGQFMTLANSSREYLLEEYKKRLITGIAISFAQNGREYKGTAAGINGSGNLLADINGQIVTVQSSEINFI